MEVAQWFGVHITLHISVLYYKRAINKVLKQVDGTLFAQYTPCVWIYAYTRHVSFKLYKYRALAGILYYIYRIVSAWGKYKVPFDVNETDKDNDIWNFFYMKRCVKVLQSIKNYQKNRFVLLHFFISSHHQIRLFYKYTKLNIGNTLGF